MKLPINKIERYYNTNSQPQMCKRVFFFLH